MSASGKRTMSETPETLEVDSFSAGACRFPVEARQVDALSHAAKAGAVDVETLLGLPVQPPDLRRCLRSAGRELLVSEPLALRALPVELIFPLPELVARRMRRGARARRRDAARRPACPAGAGRVALFSMRPWRKSAERA